ncbi:MAG: hypothetical protein KOO66_12405 [Bacteroidales bacterium]|nr:hypothetical protein [Bacteroidales bacterium]
MKKLLFTLSFLLCLTFVFGQNFTVPERTIEQKHNRVVWQTYGIIISEMSYAKSLGKTAEEVSIYTGNLFKTGWNQEGGFESFVKGVLFNFESFRLASEPAIEILQQSENQIIFKVKNTSKSLFEKGDYYEVSYEEFNNWLLKVYQIIAEHMGAIYEQKEIEDDWIEITITKK